MTKKNIVIGAVAFVLLAFLAWHWTSRASTEADDQNGATSAAVPAAVVPVVRKDIANTLVISGEFKPFQDVDVHAKVAGYIRKIFVDVGDHVRDGQTLAELEIPELTAQLSGADAAVRAASQQIRRAEGEVQRAQSTHAATHAAYGRLKQAADSRAGLVAQQEVDDSQAKDLGAEAQVASAEAELDAAKQQLEVAQANQKQYAAMTGYTRITAPFAGVVTKRYADTGTLVAAGTSSSTQAIPVVRIAQISKLRLVLEIPESAAGQIRLGDAVGVHVEALHRDIQGKVARFASSLDEQTRTMETEIDFENRDGQLLPGMYTETNLVLQGKKNALTVPLEAVARNGSDATVLAVNSGNLIEEKHVTLGIEDNARVEIVAGLREGDRVVIGNRSQFRAGEHIQPAATESSKSGSAGTK
ncbi:MAG: efflux RND transporter periplasmic adaptor subunit [Acidobacteria bacterium]|nr:efflux RND transporter periplasmic adaptor subunit [Acidobacteriota bacterium]MBS1867474.1 efflux RND transporter periplasmic adaptor subunit [Acidobacteriota bacterium]